MDAKHVTRLWRWLIVLAFPPGVDGGYLRKAEGLYHIFCMCLWGVHEPVEAIGQSELSSSISLSTSSSYHHHIIIVSSSPSIVSLSRNMELIVWARLTSQQTPRICLSLPLDHTMGLIDVTMPDSYVLAVGVNSGPHACVVLTVPSC